MQLCLIAYPWHLPQALDVIQIGKLAIKRSKRQIAAGRGNISLIVGLAFGLPRPVTVLQLRGHLKRNRRLGGRELRVARPFWRDWPIWLGILAYPN